MTTNKEMATQLNAVAEKFESYGLMGGDTALLRNIAKQLEEFQLNVLTEVQDGALSSITILSTIEIEARLAHYDCDNEGSDYEEISVSVCDKQDQDVLVNEHLNPADLEEDDDDE